MHEVADRGKLVAVRFGRIVVIALVASAAAGCSSSSSDPDPTPSDTVTVVTTPPPGTPTPSPTPTLSANATAALAAYRNYLTSSYRAERNPPRADYRELKKYAVDPEYGQLSDLLISFTVHGLATKGSPPRSRVMQVIDKPTGGRWPQVTIVDCPSRAPTWRPYYVKSGKLAQIAPSKADPPYLFTATIILFEHRWAVYKTTTDRSRTCVP